MAIFWDKKRAHRMPDILYISTRYPQNPPPSRGLTILLTYNNWDDYGYTTSFNVYVANNNESHFLGVLKLMFSNEHSSHAVLSQALLPGEHRPQAGA